jgi:hypothetical protein
MKQAPLEEKTKIKVGDVPVPRNVATKHTDASTAQHTLNLITHNTFLVTTRTFASDDLEVLEVRRRPGASRRDVASKTAQETPSDIEDAPVV